MSIYIAMIPRYPESLSLGRRGLLAEFDHYVRRYGPDKCWRWTGPRTFRGTPRISYAGHSRSARRVSWEIYRGEIPAGAIIVHRRRKPSRFRNHPLLEDENNVHGYEIGWGCTNPEHLLLATREMNFWPPLTREQTRKLSLADIARIKSLYLSGEFSIEKLMRVFHISRIPMLRAIKNSSMRDSKVEEDWPWRIEECPA